MNDRLQACSLLKTAGKDLSALKGMKDTTTFSDEVFGFHLQQVIEKCCKAVLAHFGAKYPYTHDLSMLLKLVEEKGYLLPSCWEYVGMTAFAMNIRYEGMDETSIPLNREKSIHDMEILYEKIQQLLHS